MKRALGAILIPALLASLFAAPPAQASEAEELVSKSRFTAQRMVADKDFEFMAILIDYLKGETPHPDLPLDVQATAFQRRVWQELIAIPCGETRTYSEIAERLGLPTGQRAVARACATNPVSLVVPCHRCLRADGGLGGYRWGVNRKEALLELEYDAAGAES